MRIFIIILMVLITPPMVAPSSSPDWIEIDIEKPIEDEDETNELISRI